MQQPSMVAIIVAFDEDRVIGKDGKLPWNIPEDMALFKRRTTGHTVIMGRKTYESLPKSVRPLPKRTNVVLTRDPELRLEGAVCVTNAEDALAVAKERKQKAFVIGGAEIYKLFLDKGLVDKIIASVVSGSHEGDAYFPALGPDWCGTVVSRFCGFEVVDYEPIRIVHKERNELRHTVAYLTDKVDILRQQLFDYKRLVKRMKAVQRENIAQD